MSNPLDCFDREPPFYTDAENPTLASAATQALRKALKDASEQAAEVGELWDVFRSFVTRYQYGEFVSSLVEGTRSELREAIAEAERAALRGEALNALKSELRTTHAEEIRDELRQELLSELKPAFEKTLRAKLLADPGFIADVKAELQRKILGL